MDAGDQQSRETISMKAFVINQMNRLWVLFRTTPRYFGYALFFFSSIFLMKYFWQITTDGRTRDIAALKVQAIPITPVTEKVTINGFGTIEPSRTLNVLSRVSGQVISLHPQFEEGGRIFQHEAIVQIDPRDYEINLAARKAAVIYAENDLKIEQGNQLVAKYEYDLFKKEIQGIGKKNELVLREPQLKDKETSLQVAKNELKRAELDLERTTIRAPFPVLIIKRFVTLGSQVNFATSVAEVVSTDKFFVKVRIPQSSLDSILFDQDTGIISSENTVRITRDQIEGNHCTFSGTAERLISNLEDIGRMVQILVSVPDPLKPTVGCPPLLLGTYVKVEITGKELSNVIKIPRKAIREQNQVYIANQNLRLALHTPEIVHQTEETIWAKNTFDPRDRIIVSEVQTPLLGTKLEIEQNGP